MPDLPQRFSQSMKQIFGAFPPKKLSLAISGGVDSMALMSLAVLWAQPRGIELKAYIADHKLREESTAEAQAVSRYISDKFSMKTSIITISGLDKISEYHKEYKKIEELAREKRREYLRNECIKDGSSHLLMAHHLNDQMELFVQRFLNGSSWYGLAGMMENVPMSLVYQPESNDNKILNIVRPLLRVYKHELSHYCDYEGIMWWEDPSNNDISLTKRNLIRRMYSLKKEPESLKPTNLAPLIEYFGDQRKKVQKTAEYVMKQLLLSGKFVPKNMESTAKLFISKDLRDLAVITLSEVLIRIIAPLSPLPQDKIITRRRKLDKVAAIIKSKKENININVLGVCIRSVSSTNTDELLFTRETPRTSQLTYVEIFKATRQWSQWNLIDNRWYMRWKLPTPNHTDSDFNSSKFFHIQFLKDPNKLLPIITPKVVPKTKKRLQNLAQVNPIFIWDNNASEQSLSDVDSIIGFPTLGITKNLDIEIQPKLCAF